MNRQKTFMVGKAFVDILNKSDCTHEEAATVAMNVMVSVIGATIDEESTREELTRAKAAVATIVTTLSKFKSARSVDAWLRVVRGAVIDLQPKAKRA